MSKIRLQKCPLTLVNNYTSSRGHDDPNKEATVVVECSKTMRQGGHSALSLSQVRGGPVCISFSTSFYSLLSF